MLKNSVYLIFACCFVFVALGPVFHPSSADSVRMRDFVSPYTGARCLIARCDPYDLEQVKSEFRASGGGEEDHFLWSNEPPVYPPSSLMVLLPTALFSYHTARVLWFAGSLLMFSAALLTTCLLVPSAYRLWALLLAAALFFTKSASEMIYIGQPSMMAIGLEGVAVYLLLNGRYKAVAIVLLAAGLALKPQMAGAIFLFLVVRRSTRISALIAGVLAAALMIAGAAWLSLTPASHDWLEDYHNQIATSVQATGVNNPSLEQDSGGAMLNLQASLAVFPEPAVYNALSYAITVVLLVWWLWASRQKLGSDTRIWLSLAAITCICLLPAYHREYDLPVLMLTFPALIYLAINRRRLGAAALLISLPLLYSPLRPSGLLRRFGSSPLLFHAIPGHQLRVFLLSRQMPIALLCLGAIYVFALSRAETKAEERRVAEMARAA